MESTSTGRPLQEHLEAQGAEAGLRAVIIDLAAAAIDIAAKINRAGLAGVLGEAGTTNVHGEDVKKLDLVANDIIIERLRATGSVCGMASEEVDQPIPPSDKGMASAYLALFDPLDGSSNIDVNVSIGTIFSLYRRRGGSGPAGLDDFLRSGREQVAAGYFVYGSSTMLVYTLGAGVDGLTLDPDSGLFRVTHEAIRTPGRGKIYSCNEANYDKWDEGTRRYVDMVKNGRGYSGRYVGSFVADIHRNLLKGGIFLYPPSVSDSGPPKGKLRLMYEANPMALVTEQAGGMATDGQRSILDITAEDIHQRVGVVIGSQDDVAEYSELQA